MKIIDPIVEVEKYNGIKIMKNIERAMRNCFSEDTEILTNIGWKQISKITNEKILTYNKDKNIYEYEDNNLLVQDYQGKMFECTHLNVKFCVTPNHRIFCRKNSDTQYSLIEAEQAFKQKQRVPKWFKNCNGLNYDDFSDVISHTFSYSINGNNWKDKKEVNKEISFKINDDLLILIGAYVTEGHISSHIKKYLERKDGEHRSGITIVITQTENKPLYNKVLFALKNLNLNYRIQSDPRKPQVKWIIITGGIALANWFIEECGHYSKNKHLPEWFRKLSKRQLTILRDILYDGDGSHTTNTHHEMYISCSNQLLDDVQELHILLGESASKRVNTVEKNQRNEWIINPKKHIKIKNFNGKVYCTQTKNGIICIRTQGKTLWIGNCYRTEGSITDDSYKRLLAKSINSGHGSVMEHEKITVRFTADIGVYKDLTRHRTGTAFSIESTRYCNYSKDKFENNIKFIKPVFYKDSWIQTEREGASFDNDEYRSALWFETIDFIENSYKKMSELEGTTPDMLRMLLPHSTAAQVVMTCNIREWRHILSLRCAKAAHPSIRQILIPLLLKFKKDMPSLFDDIEYDKEFPVEQYAKVIDLEDTI